MQVTEPPKRILDPGFVYVSATKTDVAQTWMRHGWVRPDHAKQRKTMELLNRMESHPCQTH